VGQLGFRDVQYMVRDMVSLVEQDNIVRDRLIPAFEALVIVLLIGGCAR
jgi:hypothetical protein